MDKFKQELKVFEPEFDLFVTSIWRRKQKIKVVSERTKRYINRCVMKEKLNKNEK